MVKPRQQASQAPEIEPQTPVHPVLRNLSQVDDLLKAANKRQQDKEFKIEEIELWKDCVNALAASPNGKMFLQNMIKFSGRNDPANIRDTMKMVDVGVKSAFYLTWVRPFLNPELRSTLE